MLLVSRRVLLPFVLPKGALLCLYCEVSSKRLSFLLTAKEKRSFYLLSVVIGDKTYLTY